MPPRNYRQSSRRSRTPAILLGGLGLFALMSVGIVGTLWLAGVPLNPFAADAKEDPYMVRIPINAQPIPAYSRVDRRQLLNPSKGGLMYQQVPPEASVGMSIVGIDEAGSHIESLVESVKNVDDNVVFVVEGGAEVQQQKTFSLGGAIMDINAILGRVVKADKRAGLGFTENTFFPKGTPEGLAGATPRGMRAITLDATRLTGVHSLGAGDQIDLLASIPISEDPEGGMNPGSEVELLAQNAKVLRPVYVRNEVTSSASLMNGSTTQNVPKYEVAIAVAADDVIPLQNALNQKLSITCIAHSMQPGSGGEGSLTTSRVDEVRVPVTVRPILAYDVVSRDAFVSPATRTLKTAIISQQEADRLGVITSINEALGAITRQDIPAGRYLRHSDLLKGPPGSPARDEVRDVDAWDVRNDANKPSAEPRIAVTRLTRFPSDSGELRSAVPTVTGADAMTDSGQFVSMLQQPDSTTTAPAATAVGDRPAISSFVPTGMRAFAIPFDSLLGSEHLKIGDRIDLMVSYQLEDRVEERETEISETAIETRTLIRETFEKAETQRGYESSFDRRTESWFVAMEAITIGPLGFPAPASALRQMQGLGARRSGNQNQHVQLARPPIMIAVSNLDAENVAAALVSKNPLFSMSLHGDDRVDPGMKRVAIAPGKLTRLDAFKESGYLTNRRGPIFRYVSNNDPRYEGAIEAGKVNSFYGRVLSRSKQRWDVLREDDFFPVGISAGLAANVQPCHSVLVVDTTTIESLVNFEEGDQVSILLRDVSSIPSDVIYSGLSRRRPWSDVVVDNVRLIRVEGQAVCLELHDSDVSVLQAALATANSSGAARRLVAVVRPRAVEPELSAAGSSRSSTDVVQPRIPSFDSRDNLHFMQVIIAGDRDIYAFDGK